MSDAWSLWNSLSEFGPEWAAWGLWGLGLYSFLAATLLPGGSELALGMMIAARPEMGWTAVGVATLGNSLGGLLTYLMGRAMPNHWAAGASQGGLPAGQSTGQPMCTGHPGQSVDPPRWRGAIKRLERHGSPLLVLSWLPVIGDLLCLGAGWLRLHWLPCLGFIALGKGLRYLAVAGIAHVW